MKKRLFIIAISFFAALNLSWPGHHRFIKTTPENQFSHLKTAQIDIAYLPNTPVAQNIKSLAKQLEKNLAEAESVLDIKLDEPLHAYIYNSFQEKGDHIQDIQLADAIAKNKTIYCIWNKTFDGLAERMEYEVLLYEKFGDSSDDHIGRAVTAAFADRWNHKSLQDWNRVLADKDLIPDWNYFTKNEHKISEFITIPYLAIMNGSRYGAMSIAPRAINAEEFFREIAASIKDSSRMNKTNAG